MEFVTWPIKINLFDIINRHFTPIHGESKKIFSGFRLHNL